MSALPEDHRLLAQRLRWLWEQIAADHAARPAGGTVRTVRLPDGEAQREQVADLLGEMSIPEAGSTLRLSRVQTALSRLDPPCTLDQLVASVGGPAPSRSAARDRHERSRDKVVTRLLAQLPEHLAPEPDAARRWLAEVAGAADLRRQRELADQLAAVVDRLPAPQTPLPVFAQQAVGDTKALDRNSDLGRLLVRVLAGRVATSAADWRAVLATHGILADALSSGVLAWQLPLEPTTPAGRLAAAFAAEHEPASLPLRLLARGLELPPGDGRRLWLCENPALVEVVAGQRLHVALACYAGVASDAARRVVVAAAAAGWTVMVGADLEPGGLRAARTLLDDAGAAGRPWRLTADEHTRGRPDARPVTDQCPPTPWDPQLAATIDATRRRVTEEGRLPALLADLRAAR